MFPYHISVTAFIRSHLQTSENISICVESQLLSVQCEIAEAKIDPIDNDIVDGVHTLMPPSLIILVPPNRGHCLISSILKQGDSVHLSVHCIM